ncbi:MAG: hypothetical protein M3R41_03465 [Pseudomonadota bacterium]|nr:hypothetical protein [Pseudomonadota bacterium]
MILFLVSLVLFLIGFGQAVLGLKNTAGESMIAGEPVSAGVISFLLFLSGTFTSLAAAAVPFIGAVAINRWDRRNG